MNWQLLTQFHFLRPEFLLLLVVAPLVYWFVRRREDVRERWKDLIAPHLLDNLIVGRRSRWTFQPIHLIVSIIVIGALALAGPTWERELPPFSQDQAPLVVVLELAQTMDAIDVRPTRLERSKQKVRDLLALRPGARTALIVYGKTAHMVLPLTDDPGLMEIFLASLSTNLLPADGRDAVAALTEARTLLAREETPGTILFITDGIAAGTIAAFRDHGQTSSDGLIVLGAGTSEGGPIRAGENRFATDKAGRRLTAKMDVDGLRRLGAEADVPVMTVTVDDEDVQWIQRRVQSHLEIVQQENAEERWRDFGYYLTFPIGLLAAFWFRRGWTVRWSSFALMLALVAAPEPAAAEFRWMDLFLTADQQGRFYFEQGDYEEAAQRFADPLWKGLSNYRSGNYSAAIDQFALEGSADADFYLGNCYAQLGDYPAAVASYDDALTARTDFPQAVANRELVAALIPPPPADEPSQQGDPHFKPDEVKFDDQGKKGKEGEVERTVFTDEQMAEIWMRNIQTSPADFLRRKFAIQAAGDGGAR
jgi:Ca-activated chloride channel homolog